MPIKFPHCFDLITGIHLNQFTIFPQFDKINLNQAKQKRGQQKKFNITQPHKERIATFFLLSRKKVSYFPVPQPIPLQTWIILQQSKKISLQQMRFLWMILCSWNLLNTTLMLTGSCFLLIYGPLFKITFELEEQVLIQYAFNWY